VSLLIQGETEDDIKPICLPWRPNPIGLIIFFPAGNAIIGPILYSQAGVDVEW
jgi:hypothetical protein